MGCLVPIILVDDLAVGETVADAGVEVDALRESRAKSVRHLRWHVGIDVAASSRELDPQLRIVGAIDETADDRRGHEPSTHQAASGADRRTRPRLSAPAMPPRARTAPAIARGVQR